MIEKYKSGREAIPVREYSSVAKDINNLRQAKIGEAIFATELSFLTECRKHNKQL